MITKNEERVKGKFSKIRICQWIKCSKEHFNGFTKSKAL